MGKTFKDEESAKRTAWIGRVKRERNFNPAKKSGPSKEWWEDRADRCYVDVEPYEAMYDDVATL